MKRLFFGFDVIAPWLEELPGGRLVREECRHLTVAFLGLADYDVLSLLLPKIPLPPFQIGLTGHFDKCLFLPERHPRVVAWHANIRNDFAKIEDYQHHFNNWLKEHGFHVDQHDHFLPHVTLCRSPFIIGEWKKSFKTLPFFIKNLHLYESVGGRNYQSLWHYPLLMPFEEFEHTADIAFTIRGENIQQLYRHALTAMAFKFPELTNFYSETSEINDIDTVIVLLNDIIATADGKIGCPFKAVSYHGDIIQEENGLLKWEMIIDV